MTATSPPTGRRKRIDAVENRAKLLAAAREVFKECGPRSSLNEVAKRAGVGSATLYRHFPSAQALLVEIISGDVAMLCETGRSLLSAPDPGAALLFWLRAFAAHAAAMQGLLATQMVVEFVPGDGNALAGVHDDITLVASHLLERAKAVGASAPETDVGDLLRLVAAIAWGSQQVPDDVDLIDRLLAISLGRPH